MRFLLLTTLTLLTPRFAAAADVNTNAIEADRLQHVQSAQTLEEFLEWATPAEIAADLGMDPDSSILEDAIDQTYAVEIQVHLNSEVVDMQAPETGSFRARALGGRPGHGTPTGCFHPISLERLHWSRKYNAPMPNSVFFAPGVALHTGSLSVQSHGCVHLADATSALIYRIVSAHRNSTRICVSHD